MAATVFYQRGVRGSVDAERTFVYYEIKRQPGLGLSDLDVMLYGQVAT